MKAIKDYLLDLQTRLCTALEVLESAAQFQQHSWQNKLGNGITCVLVNDTFEKAGVNVSHVFGENLPTAATDKRPELAGSRFEAMGVSLVAHPRNPFVPTAHLNVRFFQATKKNGETVWWFGGGYDLTPYYAFEEDCVHWHKTAKRACDAVDLTFYPRFKQWADDYFYIKHRDEQRGIGGLFFDDLNEHDFDTCFRFLKNVGDSFIDAYVPIVEKRKSHDYTQKHRDFQCYRRGRYAEFNLIYDRGTLFGLQCGGRTESILMSLPPAVNWVYDWQLEADSAEARLTEYFLKSKAWINDNRG